MKFLMKEDSQAQTSFVIDDTAVTASGYTAPTAFFSPLDYSGDGRSDILAVTSSGDVYLYRGNGLGGFSGGGTKIASV